MSKKPKIKNIQDFHRNVFNVLPKTDQYNAIRSNLIKRYEPLLFCEQNEICKTCGRYYSEIPKKFEIVPSKKPNRFCRRLLKKAENNIEGLQGNQLKLYRKLKTQINIQTIRMTCQFCNHTIEKKKPKRIMPTSKTKSKIVEIESKIKSTKKVKKAKEFAGLNKNAVLSVKRKIEATNPKEEITLKRKKLDECVILLDTPVNSPVIENSANEIVESNIVGTIDKSIIYIDKTPAKNAIDTQPELINLVTPQPSVINLETPVTKNKNKNALKVLSSKKKKENSNIIIRKKLANKILASDKKTPGKSNKKLNSLQNILSDDSEINKTISNLEQFLKSIS